MDIPIRLLETETLAADTHLIRILGGEGVSPVAIHLNSMVITGREPVVVDTGAGVARDLWFEAVEAVVDPADVRWIFLSHDDPDHTGNLLEMLDRAPRATLVTNWFTVERMSASCQLPMDRMRWKCRNPSRRKAGSSSAMSRTSWVTGVAKESLAQ